MNISTALSILSSFFDSKLVCPSVSVAATRIGSFWLLDEAHSWRAAFQCVYFRGRFFGCLRNTSFSNSRKLYVYKIIKIFQIFRWETWWLFRKYTSNAIISLSTSSVPKIFLLKANLQKFVPPGMSGVCVCILNFAIIRWCPVWALSGVRSSYPLLVYGKEEVPQTVCCQWKQTFTVLILDCSIFWRTVNAHVMGSVWPVL